MARQSLSRSRHGLPTSPSLGPNKPVRVSVSRQNGAGQLQLQHTGPLLEALLGKGEFWEKTLDQASEQSCMTAPAGSLSSLSLWNRQVSQADLLTWTFAWVVIAPWCLGDISKLHPLPRAALEATGVSCAEQNRPRLSHTWSQGRGSKMAILVGLQHTAEAPPTSVSSFLQVTLCPLPRAEDRETRGQEVRCRPWNSNVSAYCTSPFLVPA